MKRGRYVSKLEQTESKQMVKGTYRKGRDKKKHEKLLTNNDESKGNIEKRC